MTRLAPRVLCSRAVSGGQCRLTLWGTLDARAGADVAPPRPFPSIAAMYPVLASAYCAGHLAVRSRLGPNVDGVAGRIKEVSYYHRGDALRA